MEALDVDEVVAQLLASEGFRSVEELAYVEPRELASIEGFDEDTAARDPVRAPRNTSPASRPSTTRAARNSASPTSCKEIDGLTTAMLVALGENDVKTVEDLAGLRHRRPRRLDGAQGRRGHPPRGGSSTASSCPATTPRP